MGTHYTVAGLESVEGTANIYIFIYEHDFVAFCAFFFHSFLPKKKRKYFIRIQKHALFPSERRRGYKKKIAHKFAGGYRHFQSSVTHVANMENGFSIHMAFERLEIYVAHNIDAISV